MLSINNALSFTTLLPKGVLAGTGYNSNAPSTNFYNTKASMEAWPAKWLEGKRDSYGWFAWLISYQLGARSAVDDPIQIERWQNFARRHSFGLLTNALKSNIAISHRSFWPKCRQALLHWGLDSEHPRTYIGFCADLIGKLSLQEQTKLQQLGFIPQTLSLPLSPAAALNWCNTNSPTPIQQQPNWKAYIGCYFSPTVAATILSDSKLRS